MKRREPLHNHPTLKPRRRELRKSATPAEAFLWSAIRAAKLGGRKFRRQHSIGPYIVDFYCPECRIVVELDGEAHSGVIASERDAVRTRFLAGLGIRVLRFENREVFENREYVLEVIRSVMEDRT